MAGTGPGSPGGYWRLGPNPHEEIAKEVRLRNLEERIAELEKKHEQRIKELEAELERLRK